MKVLAVAPQPFFTPRGTPFSVYYRTMVTAKLGYEVDLLTYGQGEDVDIEGVNIIRIPGFSFLGHVKIGPSFFKLFLDVFIAFWLIALLFRRRYAYVHAHEEAVFLCAFLKPLFRFKLVYDMHSSLPQQLENFKFSKASWLIWIFRKLEDFSLRSAEAVITICPDLADYALSQIDDPGKHFLIENSIFEPIRFKEKQAAGKTTNSAISQEARNFVTERPAVVYAGTLEAYQGIDLLIQAFELVNRDRPDVGLLIVGGRPEQVAEYKRLAAKHLPKESIFFTGQVTPEEARSLSKEAAVLASPRSRGTNTPLKVYEQLASGIPLVATNIYSHTQVLSDDVAFLAEPVPRSLADKLIVAFQSNEKVERTVANAQKLYREKYSEEVYVDKMKSLLECLDLCAE